MENEIVLPAGTDYVPTADIPELIAHALNPDQPQTVSYFIKFGRPGATGEAAKWSGRPLDDEDQKVLDRVWADLPPLPEHATADEVRPYLDAFRANSAGLDWELDVCWNGPIGTAILRLDAEQRHRAAVTAAIRCGQLKAVSPHTRLPAPEFQPSSVVSLEELRRYVGQYQIQVRVEAESQDAADVEEGVAVGDLAWLLATRRADEHPESWQSGDNAALRRTIVSALRLRGWPAGGITGVVPQIAEMVDAGYIKLHRVGGETATPSAEAISAKPDAWWLSADDAQRVLAALCPGVRRYTLTGVAESIAKRTYPNDYVSEYALKNSLIAEMQKAVERKELPINERRRDGEVWLSECAVDEWLTRERKPYRLSVVAHGEHDEAAMQCAGRLTIEEVARQLSKATGIDAERWERTVVEAVQGTQLPLKNPRNLADFLPYGVPQNLRAFYDRLDVTDVNRWLDAHPEWRVSMRFSLPDAADNQGKPHADPPKSGASPMHTEGPNAASQSSASRTHRMAARAVSLATEIEEARKLALNPNDPASVWAELLKLADAQKGALIGQSSDGVQYRGPRFQECGEPDVFTRKNLRDRMRRAKARGDAPRLG